MLHTLCEPLYFDACVTELPGPAAKRRLARKPSQAGGRRFLVPAALAIRRCEPAGGCVTRPGSACRGEDRALSCFQRSVAGLTVY